ncbi:MAG: Eco57I restriction-modification methylase domain-containing protein, partial [Promethearchaeota archaeon]
KENTRHLYFFHLFTRVKQYIFQELQKHSMREEKSGNFDGFQLLENEKLNNTILFLIFLWILQRKGMISSDFDFFSTLYRKISLHDDYPIILAHFIEESFFRIFSSNNSIFNQSISEQINFKNNISKKNNFMPILTDNKKKIEKLEISTKIDPFLFHDNKLRQLSLISLSNIPTKCLYNAEISISGEKIKKWKDVEFEIPIFNACLHFEKKYGNITENDLGDLFERFLHTETKNHTGAFYTPAYICLFIARNLLFPRILSASFQKCTKLLNTSHNQAIFKEIEQWSPSKAEKTIDMVNAYLRREDAEIAKEVIRTMHHELIQCRILDPAVGTGEFLLAMDEVILEFASNLWQICRERKFYDILKIHVINKEVLDLATCDNFDEVKFLFRYFVSYPIMLYGVDINVNACFIARWRFYLRALNDGSAKEIDNMQIFKFSMNIRHGNALFGWNSWKNLNIVLSKGRTHNVPMGIHQKVMETYSNLFSLIKILKRQKFFPKIKKFPLSEEVLQIFPGKDSSRLLDYLLPFFIMFIDFHQSKEKFDDASELVEISKNMAKIRQYLQDLLDALFETQYFPNQNIFSTNLRLFHWILEFPEFFIPPSPFFHPNKSIQFNPGFDLIIGNPPYGDLLSIEEKKCINLISDNFGVNNEISSVFISRATQLLKQTGCLGYLTSYTICFNKKLSPLRQNLTRTLTDIFLATFDRDRCRLFENMTQSVSILLGYGKNPFQKENEANWFTTIMYRTFPSFANLEFQSANFYLLGRTIGSTFEVPHRIPKIGTYELTSLLSKFKSWKENNGLTLRNWLSPSIICENQSKLEEINEKYLNCSKTGLWIRISGNYWYNAWDKLPYFGTQIAFLPINSSKPYIRDFVLLLINSSLFYTWFRIFSDGRHMNSDILSAFPLPTGYSDILTQFAPILNIYRMNLMELLFRHYDPKRKRFNSSQIKPFLDLGDFLLGILLQLPLPLISYIIQFDNTIRGSIYSDETEYLACEAWFNRFSNLKYSPEMLNQFKKLIAKIFR